MNAIKVKKDDLLAKLRTNRELHEDEFNRAADGYRKRVIAALELRLSQAKNGQLPQMVFNLPTPINQTKEYDMAIGMLEMSVEDVIELEEHDYKQYVLDQWGWSQNVTATNAMYTRTND